MNATSAIGSDSSALGNRREDLAQAALQQLREIAAEEHRDENRGADDRHGQQHLERRLGRELNRDDRPVGGGEQRAALEQQLEVQIAFDDCMLSSPWPNHAVDQPDPRRWRRDRDAPC